VKTVLKIFVPLTLFLLASVLLSARTGVAEIPWTDIVHFRSNIFVNIRLPRIVAALIAGGSLAVSGAILQSVLRNPLAAPEIIGISSGGALAAVFAAAAMPHLAAWTVPLTFSGALTAAAVIYLLAWKSDGASPLNLVLSGVAVSSLLTALASGIIFCNSEKIVGVLGFLSGSLAGANWGRIGIVWQYAAAGVAGAMLLSGRLDVMQLGDDSAKSLGIRVEVERVFMLAVAALLASAAVALVGLLGFVGLAAPHIVRKFTGARNTLLIPGSLLFGGGLVAACDALSKWLFQPRELPAGIIMGVGGALFFLYLIRRTSGRMNE